MSQKLAGCVSNIAKRTLMEVDQNREEIEFYDEMKDLFWRRFASIQRDEQLWHATSVHGANGRSRM